MPETVAASITETLTTQFNFVAFVFPINLAGISEEEARVRPEPGANSINWLIGHMITIRQRFLAGFEKGPFLSDSSVEYYKRGSKPGESPTPAPESLATLVDAFQRAQEAMLEVIARLDDEALANPAPFSPGRGPETVGTLLAKMVVHEGYHVGQIGIVRRMLGKAGAIQ